MCQTLVLIHPVCGTLSPQHRTGWKHLDSGSPSSGRLPGSAFPLSSRSEALFLCPPSSKNIGWSLQRAKFSHRRQKTCWIQVTFVFLEGVHGKAWAISMKRKEEGNGQRIVIFYHLINYSAAYSKSTSINTEKRQTRGKYQNNVHLRSIDKTSGFWRKYQGWVYDKLKDRQRRDKNPPPLRWSCILK